MQSINVSPTATAEISRGESYKPGENLLQILASSKMQAIAQAVLELLGYRANADIRELIITSASTITSGKFSGISLIFAGARRRIDILFEEKNYEILVSDDKDQTIYFQNITARRRIQLCQGILELRIALSTQAELANISTESEFAKA